MSLYNIVNVVKTEVANMEVDSVNLINFKIIRKIQIFG